MCLRGEEWINSRPSNKKNFFFFFLGFTNTSAGYAAVVICRCCAIPDKSSCPAQDTDQQYFL